MPILIGALISLAIAWLRGASPLQLASVRLRWLAVPLLSVVAQIVGFIRLSREIGDFAVWLQLLSLGALLVFLVANLRYRALALVAFGVALNLAAVVSNGGYMPVRLDDLARAGFPQNAAKIIRDGHYEKSTALTEATLLPWLGDVIYLPLPYGPGRMISIGDVFVAAGTFLFIQEALVPSRRRTPTLRAAPAAS